MYYPRNRIFSQVYYYLMYALCPTRNLHFGGFSQMCKFNIFWLMMNVMFNVKFNNILKPLQNFRTTNVAYYFATELQKDETDYQKCNESRSKSRSKKSEGKIKPKCLILEKRGSQLSRIYELKLPSFKNLSPFSHKKCHSCSPSIWNNRKPYIYLPVKLRSLQDISERQLTLIRKRYSYWLAVLQSTCIKKKCSVCVTAFHSRAL